jgi:hypothetical protein
MVNICILVHRQRKNALQQFFVTMSIVSALEHEQRWSYDRRLRNVTDQQQRQSTATLRHVQNTISQKRPHPAKP